MGDLNLSLKKVKDSIENAIVGVLVLAFIPAVGKKVIESAANGVICNNSTVDVSQLY